MTITRLDFVITAADIHQGVTSDPNRCPVAFTLARVYPHRAKWGLVVACDHIYLDGIVFALSAQLQRFIRDFDLGRIVKPSRFVVARVLLNTMPL